MKKSGKGTMVTGRAAHPAPNTEFEPSSVEPSTTDTAVVEMTKVGQDADSIDGHSPYTPGVLKPGSKWRVVQRYLHVLSMMNLVASDARELGGRPVTLDAADQLLWESRVFQEKLSGEKPWWIMLPQCGFRRAWDMIMMWPLLYVAFVIPFRIFFEEEAEGFWMVLEMVIYTIFVLDIILNFFTAFEDSDSQMIIVSPKAIAIHYIKGWFFLDLIASVPIDYVLASDSGSWTTLGRLARLPRALRILRLLRLVKLFRVVHLQSKLRQLEDFFHMNPAIGRLGLVLFWACFFIHIVACIWHFVGIVFVDDQTWLDAADIAESHVSVRYLHSTYWALTTLSGVGYGDIVPETDPERAIAMLCMFVGMGWAAITVSTVTSIMAQVDNSDSQSRKRLKEVTSFVKDAQLPRELRHRVKAFFKFTDEEDSYRATAYNAQNILARLSPSLRQEVVLYSSRALLLRLPFLSTEPLAVQSFLVERLKRVLAQPAEYVCIENTFANEMYFIVRGRVNYVQGRESIASYGSGSHFGEIDCLFSPVRIASVQAVTTCELYSLSRSALQIACAEFISFGARLRRVAHKRLETYEQRLGRPLMDNRYMEHVRSLGLSMTHVPREDGSDSAQASMTPVMRTRLSKSTLVNHDTSATRVSTNAVRCRPQVDVGSFSGRLQCRQVRTTLSPASDVRVPNKNNEGDYDEAAAREAASIDVPVPWQPSPSVTARPESTEVGRMAYKASSYTVLPRACDTSEGPDLGGGGGGGWSGARSPRPYDKLRAFLRRHQLLQQVTRQVHRTDQRAESDRSRLQRQGTTERTARAAQLDRDLVQLGVTEVHTDSMGHDDIEARPSPQESPGESGAATDRPAARPKLSRLFMSSKPSSTMKAARRRSGSRRGRKEKEKSPFTGQSWKQPSDQSWRNTASLRWTPDSYVLAGRVPGHRGDTSLSQAQLNALNTPSTESPADLMLAGRSTRPPAPRPASQKSPSTMLAAQASAQTPPRPQFRQGRRRSVDIMESGSGMGFARHETDESDCGMSYNSDTDSGLTRRSSLMSTEMRAAVASDNHPAATSIDRSRTAAARSGSDRRLRDSEIDRWRLVNQTAEAMRHLQQGTMQGVGRHLDPVDPVDVGLMEELQLPTPPTSGKSTGSRFWGQ